MKTIIIVSLLLLALFSPKNAYAATHKESGQSARLVSSVDSQPHDARARILREFLKSYNSPLADSAETFIKTADKYNIDWRLVAAISGIESTFAKHLPYNSYNAWGWGIYGDNMIFFSSYDEAIETITKALRENYIDKWGAEDVHQIGKFYAASPTWSVRVIYFMNKIDEFAKKNPENLLSISL